MGNLLPSRPTNKGTLLENEALRTADKAWWIEIAFPIYLNTVRVQRYKYMFMKEVMT